MALQARRFYPFVMALALSGCMESVGNRVLMGEQRPEIDPTQVVLYAFPPANYEVVAMVSSRSLVYRTEQEKIDMALAKLKQQAAEIGANGIVLLMRSGEIPNWKPGTLVTADNIGDFAEDREHDVLFSGEAIYVPAPQASATPQH